LFVVVVMIHDADDVTRRRGEGRSAELRL
jgi:hypothetical protein